MSNPVLLLHGLATSAARTWRDNGWIDLLTDAGRQVLAPDLLGHGEAPKPHDPAAYDALEQRVLDELDANGVATVDAIGFSLGARTILALASAHPERFGRIVVTGVGANLFRQDDPEPIARALESDDAADNPIARYFRALAAMPDADPAALAALLRRPGGLHVTAEGLLAVTGPVLVVLGDQDFAGPPEPLVEALPDARLVVLRGCDHFATPKDFRAIDATLEFLGVFG